MNHDEIAIPFDVRDLHENIVKRVIEKCINISKKATKRLFDIVFSVIVLILLVPISIMIKLAYMLKGDFKSIFTTQESFGKNGKIFKVVKYRSINKDGQVNRLRRTALDNLPKVVNILLGDMTIVGPQPYSVDDREKMGTYFERITLMKPGITGIAQISFLRDLSFEARLDNDIKYYYKKNWFTDLKIIFITTLITLPRRNKGELLSFLNVTIKDLGRLVLKVLNMIFKRTIDICGGIVGTLILIPLTLVVWMINIFSGDRGPLFYSQERIGKNGKHFKMYKFRSMVVGADEKLKELLQNDPEARREYMKYRKLKHDPRITKAGNFLRKTSLDEFPQFINVIKGEMSLVGPRPYLPGEVNAMDDMYDIIIKHKPGITGLWQVSGRSDVTFEDRLELDMKYHKNSSAVEDVKIICKTAISVIKHEGVA